MPDQSSLSSRAIIGMYYARQELTPGLGWVDGVSNLFNSDQVGETYAHLGAAPKVREWIGGRQAKSLRELPPIYIPNVHYEASLYLRKEDARRDKTGQIQARIAEFYDQGVADWASKLSALLVAGEATACYDGQYYFDTDHSEGDSGTQSNDISVDISGLPCTVHGTTTAPSKEEMQQAIIAGVAQILSLKNDQGRAMNANAREFTVLVPVSLWVAATAAVTQIVNAALGNNLNPSLVAGLTIRVEMLPELTWTTQFAIFRTDSPIKGLIRQRETEWELTAIAEGSELEAMEGVWMFGIDSWRNCDYGYWQRACLVTLT